MFREATQAEVKVYNKVNAIVNAMDEMEFENFLEVISLRVYDYTYSKSIYNRAYRLAKKYGLTLKEAETWYCLDD